MILLIIQAVGIISLVPLATLAIGAIFTEMDMIEDIKKGTYRLKNNDHG